ncbi:hypothetical protein BO70DRAFT_400911 [Aspergillus heteromorphus CBS 117.55]|uniref:Anaphase-promoting complex subunit 13 n=1 Tax=Aspergillus heteromorphus CBS 117.55 TaxID=1448321 RepID=A0A317UZX8_9EURO|nr:uncharacterized protein BO70DRAFT_400911 [Aspergillus heteromorphus CBS 117.55]PWY66117.1 hypothetical protein BO70DRAFT_400911 [Aspergillus heteromorphus CBS 117.55]
MHHPRLADYFEDFTRPHTSLTSASSTSTTSTTHPHTTPRTTHPHPSHSHSQSHNTLSASPTSTPSFLPVEEIYLLPQYQPPNPEDEDDVTLYGSVGFITGYGWDGG